MLEKKEKATRGSPKSVPAAADKGAAPAVMFSLLDEPLLSVSNDAGDVAHVTLPGMLARLSQGVPTEAAALQAHQQHPWHAFLVQLAAIALTRAKQTEIAHDEASWRKLLVEAAAHDGGGPEAFALIVRDLAKPAFLQPPVPEGSLDGLKSEHVRPSEELDVLVTSKNHDVKVHSIETPRPEHWVYGLVMLQTMQGYLGAGNYGIARMNGGDASRPAIAYAAGLASDSRFCRDVAALTGGLQELLARGFASKADLALIWCSPWNGAGALAFDQLHPFFIEICRRVRLGLRATRIVAFRGTSDAPRIHAKEAHGNTGDAWTPVARDEHKALTVSKSGFTYERVQELMFGNWQHGVAGLSNGKTDRYWLGQVLVRGKGKTFGYHERWVPVPGKARSFLAKPDARAKLGLRAQQWVGFARIARLNILKPAVLNFLQGGPDKLNFTDEKAEPFLQHLNQAIDAEFFPMLFEHAESDAEEANLAFARKLLDLAEAELERAITSSPTSSARRHRAIAFAYRSFWGAARNNDNFPKVPFASTTPDAALPSQPDAGETT